MKVQGLLFYSLFSFEILADSSLPLKVLFFGDFSLWSLKFAGLPLSDEETSGPEGCGEGSEAWCAQSASLKRQACLRCP